MAGDISANSATVTVTAATITAQGNGTFDVTARLTDVAGNAGPSSAAISVTVDTTTGTGVDPDLAVAVSDPLVSNAEKTAVEFGVSGLNADASADVTFTGTTGTPVVVHVTANGIATANLSGQADGPVAVSIVATDTLGNTATGTGTSLILDSTADAGTDLAVAVGDSSINAAEKTAAGFTVSGLDIDAGADVTFTGTAGTPVVVHVTANGPASANLSGLADGPVTVSIVATDAAGNTAIGTGTSLALDTTADGDGNLTLSIPDTSIHAGERRRAVAFSTSGIDADATSATVTFTDSVGHMVTVAAASGTANLISFVSGEVTSTVDVTDAAGNTISIPGAPITLDTVNGSAEGDTIIGTIGNDTFNGLDGNDIN